MTKFSKWAGRSTGREGLSLLKAQPRPQPTPQIIMPGPQPTPQAQLVTPQQAQHVPAQQPVPINLVALQRPQQIVHPQQRRPRKAHLGRPSCVLMKPAENDRWAERLAEMHDLVAGGHITDFNDDSVDAMEMRSVPEDSAMEKWKDSSRYVNGRRDGDGSEQLDGHMGHRHGDNVGAIRDYSNYSLTRGGGRN